MRIYVIGSKLLGWELVLEGQIEPTCVVEHCTFEEALDAFAANYPEFMEELNGMKDEEFFGPTAMAKRVRQNGNGKIRKRGSGARFRELILQGKTNAECVVIVRSEFPDSKATLSDAAWNRQALRKNPSGYAPDGTKV